LTLITDSQGSLLLAIVKEDGSGLSTAYTLPFSGNTVGTAPDVTTVIEDINYFIIPAGQTMNVLGTFIVYAKRTQIDGTINGSGGGYVGAVASTTAWTTRALSGESPPDTNGHGQGGKFYTTKAGGGGGSHGKLFVLNVLLLL